MDVDERIARQESEGLMSDPPVSTVSQTPATSASPASAPASPAFPEFERTELAEWALVRQKFDPTEISDVAAAVDSALEPVIDRVRPGARVCLAAGSRGIDRIDQVVRAAVDRLKRAGASVFIVPAMGSHGGATGEGQLEVLAEYGISPETMGCEIRSSMGLDAEYRSVPREESWPAFYARNLPARPS